MNNNNKTQTYLKEILDYNPDTGVFTWKVRDKKYFKNEGSYKIWNTRFSGKIAGSIKTNKDGYRYLQITINKKLYLAHRLAWLYVYGVWPKNQIDHINGCSLDNRIHNLRDVTNQVNSCNQKKHKNNKSGITGVSWHRSTNKWIVRGSITINGKRKRIYLGLFENIDDAICARKSWESKQKHYTERHGK